MTNNEYKNISKLIIETFAADYKECALDFISFLNSQSMTFERLYGYWKNQYYYVVEYQDECVFYILINGTGEEAAFAPLTIWTDDSCHNCYEHFSLCEDLKRTAWIHIDNCVHCGSCSGGTAKEIFGRKFNNVCRTSMRFINPDKNELVLIKELAEIRKDNIVTKMCAE